ncbi:hypothetical protein MMC21_001676 [Puttea exsequens]|nr:hypothetical protein [Puttea exsequens]
MPSNVCSRFSVDSDFDANTIQHNYEYIFDFDFENTGVPPPVPPIDDACETAITSTTQQLMTSQTIEPWRLNKKSSSQMSMNATNSGWKTQ